MAKHLSTPQVDTIVEILDGWHTGTKLTWDALIKRIARWMGTRPSETNARAPRENQGRVPDAQGRVA